MKFRAAGRLGLTPLTELATDGLYGPSVASRAIPDQLWEAFALEQYDRRRSRERNAGDEEAWRDDVADPIGR